MIKIKKYVGMRTLKTALGAGVGVFIAQLLNLNYGVNTAIVVILSLQNTKRKSLNLAGVRVLSTMIALTIAKIVFSILGFGPLSFSVYLLIFIPIVVRFKLNEGLVPSSVLVSHLLASESVALGSLANELAQMVIGAAIALVLNLYIPGLEAHLINDLAAIKKLKYRILENMKNRLSGDTDSSTYRTMLDEMEQRIELTSERVLNETGENFNRGLDYHLRYLKMESDHLETIRYMNRSVEILGRGFSESKVVSDLTGKALIQLKSVKMEQKKIDDIREYLDTLTKFSTMETKDDFQIRAAVFQYLEDLIRLLDIRSEFVSSLSFADRKLFREMHSKIQETDAVSNNQD